MKKHTVPSLSIRLDFPEKHRLGPGKADLLAGIEAHGSIAAAGRAMGMSYKRAWLLVETLNTMFHEPLVTSNRGGAERGGASLTDMGRRVLTLYREVEETALRASSRSLGKLSRLVKGGGTRESA